MVNSPDSTPGEYVVGTATWTSPGRSSTLRPGTPACCSVKKATALPQSTTAPPPKVTIPSAPSPWTAAWAARTESTGRWGSTPANVDASARPTSAGQPARRRRRGRPALVMSTTRRRPSSRSIAGRSASAPDAEAQALGDVVLAPRSGAHVSILAVSG